MITPGTGAAVVSPLAPPGVDRTAAAGRKAVSFFDFLSAMNPLQYIPVVGTIYRAITGDVVPEALRDAGSMLISGLLGGPIGLLTNIVVTIGEKISGIDPERIAAAILHPASPAAIVPSEAAVAVAVRAPRGLSPAELGAYGVRSDVSGGLSLGNAMGADALNTIELVRLGQISAAYAGKQTEPPVARAALLV